VSLAAILALVAVGCGDKAENDPRVPNTLQVTARVNKDSLLISPDKFGAGVVYFTISNQTNAPVTVRFRGPTEFSSETIPAQGTTNVKANLLSGDYEVKATGDKAAEKPRFLRVGPERPSAQNDLLLP
jgi:hypothetical protein